VTEDTGIGNPKLATLEKGKKFFDDVTEKIAKVMVQICQMDSNNNYED